MTMTNDPLVRDEIDFEVVAVEEDGTIVAVTTQDLPMRGMPVTREGAGRTEGERAVVARIPPEDAAKYRRLSDGEPLG